LQEKLDSGKVELGVRRLVASHVENACSFFAYVENEATMMEDIKTVVARNCEVLDKLTERPRVEDLCGVQRDGFWLRGKVEQVGQGSNKDLVRVRMVDFGWNCLVELSNLVRLPASLVELSVRCEKYKLDQLKPKGRADGFSAADRMRGKEWFEGIIAGRMVLATCRKKVNYQGGIMVDCKVGENDINKMVLKEGFAVLKPGFADGNRKARKAVGFTGSYPGGIDQDYVRYDGSTCKQAGREMKSKNIKDEGSEEGGKDAMDVDLVLSKLLADICKVRSKRGEHLNGLREVSIMKGVVEVIDHTIVITGPLMDTIELIERLAEGERYKVELQIAVDRYLGMYSVEGVRQANTRVKHQLEEVAVFIPDSWKLVAVQADKVSTENLVEVARNVRNWLDTQDDDNKSTKTEREVESLCASLEKVAASLRLSPSLRQSNSLPAINGHLTSLRLALQTELSSSDTSNSASRKASSPPASILRSAWRALVALSGQLDMVRRKQEEYHVLGKEQTS